MLNKIAIGTAQFGIDYGIANERGQVPEEEVCQILKYAYENDIRILDSAQGYGNSEEVIGRIIDKKDFGDFDVITKIAPDNLLRISDSVYDSLGKLKIESLYGVYYHDFDSYLDHADTIHELYDLQEKGIINRIGFSIYYPHQLEHLFDKDIDFEIIQIPYSIFDRRFEGLFEEIKKRNIEIHIRSVFLQGLVFMDIDKLNEFFDPIIEKLQSLKKLSKQYETPISVLSMQFCLDNENVDRIVIGIDSFNNFCSNINDINIYKKNHECLMDLKDLQIHEEEYLLPFNWKV